MQMTRNTVSNSNKATTFRQLNRTVSFLAHPVGILCENGFGKKFCNTVRVFLYLSCTRAHHSMKWSLTFIFNVYKRFFLFLPHFYVFNVLKIFVWTFFYICGSIVNSNPPGHITQLTCQLRSLLSPVTTLATFEVDLCLYAETSVL